MGYLIAFALGALVCGMAVHFGWAAFHKAEMDGKDVMIDEAHQAETWAKHQLSEFKSRLR